MIYIPHQYQQFAEDHIIQNPNCGLLLEMGLGKTVSTLTALWELRFNYFCIGKVLVVAPKRVAQETWPAEIAKWEHAKDFTYSVVIGTEKQRLQALRTKADIYIINRENIIWLFEQYGEYVNKKQKTGFHLKKLWPFDTLVIDELSSFKNFSGKRFKMLKRMRNNFNRIIGLTGTPAPRNLLDLWAQLYLIDGGERLGPTMSCYREVYFYPTSYTKNQKGDLIATEYAPKDGCEDEIYKRIGDVCISMKSIDFLELPEVFYKTTNIELKPGSRKIYDNLERDFIVEFQNSVIDAVSAGVLSNKLQQIAQGAIYDEEKNIIPVHSEKLEALDDLLAEAQGKPVLLFYWFKHDFERLRARYSFSNTLDDTNIIERWNRGEISLLLAHPGSSGHGLNLQEGGHIVVWFSLTWSLELYQQANARLNRQGQKNPVTINHLVVKDSIDERILEVLEGKKQGQDSLMEAVKAIVSKHKNI